MSISKAQQQALAKEIRRASTPSKRDREPCAVCDKFEKITDAHHILTVEYIAEVALHYNIILDSAPMLWLCPTCHRAVHQVGSAGESAFSDFPEGQRYRLSAIAELRRNWSLQILNQFRANDQQGERNAGAWSRVEVSLDEHNFPVRPQNAPYGDGTEITEGIFFNPIGYVIRWYLDRNLKEG